MPTLPLPCRRPHVLVVGLALATTSCVDPTAQSPTLGDCADLSEVGDAYTFGQAGIGTCLAGPSSLSFRQRAGTTWLTLTNADPFLAFGSGSFEEILLDEFEVARIRVNGTTPIDRLEAFALPTERFVGPVGFLRGGTQALVGSKLSEGSFYRGEDDRVWLLDTTDPTRASYLEPRFLPVGADPSEVIVDAARQRAYVLNALSASISVFDLSGPVPRPLDTAPQSELSDPVFDAADPRTVAEARAEVVEDAQITTTDAWTATWIEGTTRLFLPEDNGLRRYSGGGVGAYRASAFGVEILPASGLAAGGPADPGFDAPCPADGRIEDPVLANLEEALVVFYREVTCGPGDVPEVAVRAALGAGEADAWSPSGADALDVRAGWSDVGGPVLVDVLGDTRLFFDGMYDPDAAGAPESDCGTGAAIGIADDRDPVTFETSGAPVVCLPGAFDDMMQPWVIADDAAGRLRMWMSVEAGGRWRIAHTSSSDAGRTWGPVTQVLDVPGGDAAAPVVVRTAGRYLMWLATDDGADGWAHRTASSTDGYTWTLDDVIAPSDRPADFRPPRAAVQPQRTEAWRLEGDVAGLVGTGLEAGTRFQSTARGFLLELAAGHVAGREAGARIESLEPGSFAVQSGLDMLWASATDEDGISRVVRLLQAADDTWQVLQDDVTPAAATPADGGVRNPVVHEADDGTWHLFYAEAVGEVWSLRHATSPDGVSWSAAPLQVDGERAPWEQVSRDPHTVLQRADGTYELWYTGADGARSRIGRLESTDLVAWTPVSGIGEPFDLGPGDPGTFDDVSVRDPAVRIDGDVTWMWYAGFDGEGWGIGIAWRPTAGGPWRRPTRPLDPANQAALAAESNTFSVNGTRAPVLTDDPTDLLYAGNDGFAWRVGDAEIVDDGAPVAVPGTDTVVQLPSAYPNMRLPTAGDTFTFIARRGQPGRSAIRLGQTIDGFPIPGSPGSRFFTGYTSMAYDPALGMLFVGTKDAGILAVVDIRDDSTPTFDDRNVLDLEAILRFDTTTGNLGTHAMLRDPSDGTLYLTIREPDGVLLVDPSAVVVDNGTKEVVTGAASGILPMHDLTDDDGGESFAAVGAAGMARIPGSDLLIVTHLRDNSVSVFDLSLGVAGEEIRHIEDVGENPHLVAASPDGTYAVVATYVGGGAGEAVGSTLLFLDTDPASATYLDILGRVVNR